MNRSFTRFVALLAVFALASSLLVAAGCKRSEAAPQNGSVANQAPQSSVGGTLSYAITEPDSIDPYNVADASGVQVVQAIFDSLTRVDPLDSRKLLPSAADTWTVSSDGMVWTFTLNPNDKFHEGTSVTSKDFIYAWNRIASPETTTSVFGTIPPSSNTLLAPVAGWDAVRKGSAPTISGLEALDERTLQVTLSKPFADFGYVVAQPALAPVPRKYIEKGVEYEGKKIAFGQMPIGNGPFKMSAPWKHDEQIKVVRNADYYGARPNLDAIDFRIFNDTSAGFDDFMDGKLDFAEVPDALVKTAEATCGTSADGYTANPDSGVLLGTGTMVDLLIFNNADKTLGNASLRKAISLAIDRKMIGDRVFSGARIPADNVIPPEVSAYREGAWRDARFSRPAARSALRAAGYPRGSGLREITLLATSDGDDARILQAIQTQLKAVGIRTRLQTTDRAALASQLGAGKFQIACIPYTPGYATADGYLAPLFGSKSDANMSQYSNASFDRGIAAGRATVDPVSRVARYVQLNAHTQPSNPAAPLLVHRLDSVAARRVHNLVRGVEGLTDFGGIWVDSTPN